MAKRQNSVDVLAAAPVRPTMTGCVPVLCTIGPMHPYGLAPESPKATGVGPERLAGAIRELCRKD